MKAKKTKIWMKPRLIVLVGKGKPEEGILQACRESGQGSHMEGVHGDCFDLGDICVLCAN